MAKQLEITLVKSPIGRKPVHKKNLQALGLRKLGSKNTLPDNPAIRGMIAQVNFMLNVKSV